MSSRLPDPTGPLPVSFTDVVNEPGVHCTSFRIYYPTTKYDTGKVDLPMAMKREYFDQLGVYMKGVALLSMAVPMNLPFVLPENSDKLPIILFSHGLLLSKDVYTFVCSDLASYGYLVAAVNHNDGSLPVTYFVEKGTNSAVGNQKCVNNRQFIAFEAPGETPNLRWEQVEIRVQELKYVMNSLEMLNEGKLSNSVLHPSFDLLQFKGRLSMGKAAVMGHSLGGATALAYLANDDRAKVTVTLDPWMLALHERYVRQKIDKPMMFINCNNEDSDNKLPDIMGIRLLDADVSGTTAARLLVTLMGTTHYTQTDLCFLPQSNQQILNIVSESNAKASNAVNTKLILSFLGKYLGLPTTDDVSSILHQEQEFVKIGTDLILVEADLAAAKNRVMSFHA